MGRSVGACMKLGKLAALLTPEEEAKALMAVPMFHITALGNTCLFSLPAGNAILMMRKWDAGEALKMIEKEKATRFTGVPTMVRDMFEHPNFKAEAFASMKNIAAGGAPVPPSLDPSRRRDMVSQRPWALWRSTTGLITRDIPLVAASRSRLWFRQRSRTQQPGRL